MKRIFTILFILVGYFANAQYNPSLHVVVNDALGVAQAVPTDSRSQFFNASTFTYRNYANRAEVLSSLNLQKYRSGRFPIYVDTAGHTGIFWFADCLLDTCLKYIQTVGGSTDSSIFATNYRVDTAKLNLRAAIAGKLQNTLATGKIWAGDLSGNAAQVVPSGDLTMTSAGSFTVINQLKTVSNGLTASGTNAKLGGSLIDNNTTLTGNTGTENLVVTNVHNFDTRYINRTKIFSDAGQAQAVFGPTSISLNGYDSVSIAGFTPAGKFSVLVPSSLYYPVTIFDTTTITTMGVADSSDRAASTAWVKQQGYGSGGGGGISNLNGLTAATQAFATGTTGTNFGIVSSGSTHTFNLPIASGTNTGKLSNTDWTTFNNKQPAGNYITALTGDVAATGPGSVPATIQPNAVTYAKIQAASAQSLLGATGAGNFQEITLGTNLSMSGSTLNASGSGSAVLTRQQDSLMMNGTFAVYDSLKWATTAQFIHHNGGSSNTRNDAQDICVAANGDWITAYSYYFAGTADGDSAAVAVQISHDQGRTWGSVSFAIPKGLFNGIPSLYTRLDGTILMLYYKQTSSTTSEIWETTSSDNGVTWASPSSVYAPPSTYFSPMSGRISKLKNGQLIYTNSKNTNGILGSQTGNYITEFLRSTDDGTTWTHLSVKVSSPDSLSTEGGIIQFEDSTILCYMRTRSDYMYYSLSTDNMATFSNSGLGTRSGLKCPNSTVTLFYDEPNQAILGIHNRLFSPHLPTAILDRQILDCSVSYDRAQSWKHLYTVDSMNKFYFFEPTVTKINNEYIVGYSRGDTAGVLFDIKMRRLPAYVSFGGDLSTVEKFNILSNVTSTPFSLERIGANTFFGFNNNDNNSDYSEIRSNKTRNGSVTLNTNDIGFSVTANTVAFYRMIANADVAGDGYTNMDHQWIGRSGTNQIEAMRLTGDGYLKVGKKYGIGNTIMFKTYSTDVGETNGFFSIENVSSGTTTFAPWIRTMSHNTGYGVLWDLNTTGNNGAFVIDAENSGGSISASNNLLLVSNNGSTKFNVFGDGKVHLYDTVRADQRISYNSNIHSSYTQYTLIDKAYADSAYSAGGGSDTLKIVTVGTPGAKMLFAGHDTLYSPYISNGTLGADTTLTINTYYNSDGTMTADRTITGAGKNITYSNVNFFKINSSLFALQNTANTSIFSSFVKSTGDLHYQIAYTPVTGVFSKGAALQIDTNNNVQIGAIDATFPLYASGASLFANSGFTNNASLFERYTTVTSNATLSTVHNNVYVDATSGNVTVTLPSVASTSTASVGIVYTIKRIDTSGNTVTVAAAGSDTIDGAANFTLISMESKVIQSAGSGKWWIQ